MKVPRPRALFAHLGISRGWLRSSGILEAGRRTPDGNRGRGSVPVPGKSGTGTGELSQSVPDSGKSGTGTGTGARRPVSAPCFNRRMLGNGHRQSALHAVGSNLNTEIGAPLCIIHVRTKMPAQRASAGTSSVAMDAAHEVSPKFAAHLQFPHY